MKISAIIKWWFDDRRLTKAEKGASRWKREALLCLRDLTKSTKSINRIRKEYEDTLESCMKRLESLQQEHMRFINEAEDNLRRSQEIIDDYDHTIDQLTNQLEVYRDTLIPQLTLANELARQELQAEISLQTQRQAFYSGGERPKE